MIHFISRQQVLPCKEIKNSSISELMEFCKDKTELGLDIETTGFDPYTKKILCVQIGNNYDQFVIDSAYFPISTYKEVFDNPSITWLGHNLKFDLRFFLHEGVIINNVYDTYITEQILWNGYDNMRKGLDFVAERYLGVFLDKSIRGNIHKEGLSMRVIRYAAEDVEFLLDIKEKQSLRANQYDLHAAIKLNNLFVPVMAYLEYCGFKLDTKLWQEKIDKDTILMEEALNIMNKFIIDNNISRFINSQLDLFNPELTASINWASPQQVVEFFNIIGIDTKIVDKDSGEIKDSASEDTLKKQADKHPMVGTYINYRKLLKRLSTYGNNWFKFISSVTGRIHTKYQQWMNTGRMSSGGKDKDSKDEWPNAQNIPADEDTRKCIVADKDHILINADYSGQENVVFANKCLDPTLLKMYDEGIDDMHGYTAWNIFPQIREKYPEITPESLKGIKKDFPKERQISKTGNFAIAYGGTGFTVAENCNIPLEDGEKFYNDYFKAFKGVKHYFETVYRTAKRRGYIEYNDITKSKYFIPKGLKDGKIKNRSFNFPVQGTSADMTKYAGILYWRYLIENNLVFKVKIVIICHDEYLLEVPTELAEQEAVKLKECMEQAADFFCKRVPVKATPVITPFWTH